MEEGNLKEFRIWLVMYTLDMLASSHQISWEEVEEGVMRITNLRVSFPQAALPFPTCDVRMIKGHTPVCKVN